VRFCRRSQMRCLSRGSASLPPLPARNLPELGRGSPESPEASRPRGRANAFVAPRGLKRDAGQFETRADEAVERGLARARKASPFNCWESCQPSPSASPKPTPAPHRRGSARACASASNGATRAEQASRRAPYALSPRRSAVLLPLLSSSSARDAVYQLCDSPLHCRRPPRLPPQPQHHAREMRRQRLSPRSRVASENQPADPDSALRAHH